MSPRSSCITPQLARSQYRSLLFSAPALVCVLVLVVGLPTHLASAQQPPSSETTKELVHRDAAPATIKHASRRAPTGSIHGVVTQAGPKTPIERATITVSGTTLATTTGAEGQYTVAGVPAGTHWVIPRRLGYAADSASVTVRDGETATADLTLQSVATRLAAVV